MVLVVFSMVSISKHHSWYYSSQTQALCVRTKRGRSRDLPGGPVSRTLLSWCKGLGFDSWSGNWVLHAATETQHSQKYINMYILRESWKHTHIHGERHVKMRAEIGAMLLQAWEHQRPPGSLQKRGEKHEQISCQHSEGAPNSVLDFWPPEL